MSKKKQPLRVGSVDSVNPRMVGEGGAGGAEDKHSWLQSASRIIARDKEFQKTNTRERFHEALLSESSGQGPVDVTELDRVIIRRHREEQLFKTLGRQQSHDDGGGDGDGGEATHNPAKSGGVDTLRMRVPKGAVPGSTVEFKVGDGRSARVRVPSGAREGQVIPVRVPKLQPPPPPPTNGGGDGASSPSGLQSKQAAAAVPPSPSGLQSRKSLLAVGGRRGAASEPGAPSSDFKVKRLRAPESQHQTLPRTLA